MTTANIRYNIATDVDSLLKMIEAAGTHYQTARRVTQVAAVNVLIHAAKHGDYSFADKLVGVCGDSQALVKWFEEFGGLTVDPEAKGFKGWEGKQHIKDNLELAKATMFWTFKAPNPYAGFDLDKQLEKLITKADRAVAKGHQLSAEGNEEDANKVVVNIELLNQLRDLQPVTVQ